MAYKNCKKIGDSTLATYAGYLAEIAIPYDYQREFQKKIDELIKTNQESYQGYTETLIIGHYNDTSTTMYQPKVPHIMTDTDRVLSSFLSINSNLAEMQDETRKEISDAIDRLIFFDISDEKGNVLYSKVHCAKEVITSALWEDSRICNTNKGIIIIVYHQNAKGEKTYTYGAYNLTTSEAISALSSIGKEVLTFRKINTMLRGE